MKTLKEWKRWINAHSVNMGGVYFINAGWVVKEIEKEYKEVKK